MIVIHTAISPLEVLPKGNLILEDRNQYPMIRKQIHDALEQKIDLHIFVLTRVCDDWFWDLSEYNKDVLFQNDSPNERLKRKLSIDSLPNDLAGKPEFIIELDLLDLPNPPEKITDIWLWIIKHKLGEIWTAKEPTQTHFSQLVKWYIENRVHPSLQFKIDSIAKSWIQNLAPGKLKSAYARFFENPTKNAHLIVAARALLLYDHKLREQWLTAEEWYSPRLEDLIDLIEPLNTLPKNIRNKLNPTILTYWNTRLKELFHD